MSNFQVTIIEGKKDKFTEADEQPSRFEVQKHKKGVAGAVEKIEELEKVWDKVIKKLSGLASKSTAASSEYELSEIEFNIGIEGGLNIGLVTKGNASVSLTFKKN